jgi:hypothetical protein
MRTLLARLLSNTSYAAQFTTCSNEDCERRGRNLFEANGRTYCDETCADADYDKRILW